MNICEDPGPTSTDNSPEERVADSCANEEFLQPRHSPGAPDVTTKKNTSLNKFDKEIIELFNISENIIKPRFRPDHF